MMTKKKVLALLLALVMTTSLVCVFAGSAAAEYEPAAASVKLTQSFSATNNHEPLSNDPGLVVTYKLTPKEGQDGSVDRLSLTLTGDQSDSFNFSYTHAGIYNYTLTPEVTDREFFDYDDTVYTLRVRVRNLPDGKLYPVVEIWNESGDQKISEGNGVNYEHKYDLVIVPLELDDSADPIGQKVISGSTPKTDSVFTFTFRPVSSNAPNITALPMPSAAGGASSLTLSITGQGKIPVGSLTFTEPGTYVYQITENNGGVQGYTYDTRIYYVTFVLTLSDDPATHQYLSATRTITLNGAEVDVAEFNNIYIATTGGVIGPIQFPDLGELDPLPTIDPYSPEGTTPVETIQPTEPPLPPPDPGEAWALVNLISAILTVGVAGGMSYSYFKKAKSASAEEQSKLKTKILGWIPAAGSLVTFFLTEDLSAPMALTDKWTILMAGILAANGVAAYLTRAKKAKVPTTTA